MAGLDMLLRDWSGSALCAQVDPELFSPDQGANGAAAKRLCGRCLVVEPCREEAVATPGIEGVWGGTTTRERRKLRQAGGAL
jgi:WhiB family redox-sensing transcriptional regulator